MFPCWLILSSAGIDYKNRLQTKICGALILSNLEDLVLFFIRIPFGFRRKKPSVRIREAGYSMDLTEPVMGRALFHSHLADLGSNPKPPQGWVLGGFGGGLGGLGGLGGFGGFGGFGGLLGLGGGLNGSSHAASHRRFVGPGPAKLQG